MIFLQEKEIIVDFQLKGYILEKQLIVYDVLFLQKEKKIEEQGINEYMFIIFQEGDNEIKNLGGDGGDEEVVKELRVIQNQ